MSNQSDLAKSAAGFNGDPLSIDTTNNRVGIGTSSHYDASTKLTVAGRINTSNGTAIGSMNYGGGAVVNIGSLSNHPVQLMTNNTTRVVVDTAGRVTMPYQPSFYASISSDVAQDTAAVHILAPYNTVVHNEGNHFSTSTSLFTAPVSGVYQFNSTLRFNNINSGAYFLQKLYINPTISSGTVTTGTNPSGMYSISTVLSSYNTRMLAGTIKLSANDTVGITGYSQGDTNWQFDNNSHFSGYLIG